MRDELLPPLLEGGVLQLELGAFAAELGDLLLEVDDFAAESGDLLLEVVDSSALEVTSKRAVGMVAWLQAAVSHRAWCRSGCYQQLLMVALVCIGDADLNWREIQIAKWVVGALLRVREAMAQELRAKRSWGTPRRHQVVPKREGNSNGHESSQTETNMHQRTINR